MPVIKSAIKKFRRDRKREKANEIIEKELDRVLKLAKKQKTQAAILKAVSAVDKAVKKNLMHKNRAARIKSSLSKLARIEGKVKQVVKQAMPIKKTTASKKAKKTSKK